MEKPDELIEARKLLEERFEYVGTGYGFVNVSEDKEMGWFLIIWSDDENLKYPETFKGFRVTRKFAAPFKSLDQ